MIFEEAEISQVENAVTSSSKRAYRKGNPLSVSERKMRSLSRKRDTHKPVNVLSRILTKISWTHFVRRMG
ncbi:TPA: RepB family protein [Salmonella enterica]